MEVKASVARGRSFVVKLEAFRVPALVVILNFSPIKPVCQRCYLAMSCGSVFTRGALCLNSTFWIMFLIGSIGRRMHRLDGKRHSWARSITAFYFALSNRRDGTDPVNQWKALRHQTTAAHLSSCGARTSGCSVSDTASVLLRERGVHLT